MKTDRDPSRHFQYDLPTTAQSREPTPVVVIDGVVHEFPGCCRVHIPRDEIADFDGRFEYWDADTETALMVREPTSPYHEQSSVRLARMADRIAATWGSDIEVLGASDLLLRDADGNRHRIMQADQIVYAHPIRTRPLGHAVEVDANEVPDVVLEVDLTTDVRRGKLGLYESWGFPEVWVEVPDERSPSRPNRQPGLTIHLLGENGYAEAPSSVAFPTWTADEIHSGMNEKRMPNTPMSEATAAVLRRVGRLMRKDTGTGPDDDPFLRAERAESREEGHIRGRAEGLADGRIEGRVETLQEMMRSIFEVRGLPMSDRFAALVEAAADLPVQALLHAAEACRDEADFARHLAAAPLH